MSNQRERMEGKRREEKRMERKGEEKGREVKWRGKMIEVFTNETTTFYCVYTINVGFFFLFNVVKRYLTCYRI